MCYCFAEFFFLFCDLLFVYKNVYLPVVFADMIGVGIIDIFRRRCHVEVQA